MERSATARRLEQRRDPNAELPLSTAGKFLKGQVVLVGYGRVGQRIAQAMSQNDIPYVVAEQNRELVEKLRSQGITAVSGNASEPEVLIHAHIADAAMLVVAVPDALDVRQMVEIARSLNPGVRIALRTHSEEEAEMLRREDAGAVFFGEEELAKGMAEHVLERFQRRT